MSDDTEVFSVDTDGDGGADVAYVDALGDGTIDAIVDDADYDGLVDTIYVPGQTLHLDEVSGRLVDVDDLDVDAVSAEEQLVPTEPDPSAEVGAETLAGDPTADAEYWFPQSQNGWCAPASVTQVVAEFTGRPVTEAEVVGRAQELGLLSYDENDPAGHPFGGWSGMTVEATEQLLDDLGVPSTTSSGDIVQLETFLREGRSVLVPVDSSEAWTGEDDDRYGDVGSDHMLVVTGIDQSDGVVYMNDPGQPDGAARMVPLDTFVDAWEDGGNTMIVTDTAPATNDAEVATDAWAIEIVDPVDPATAEPIGPMVQPDEASAVLCGPACTGVVILPMTMSGEAFARAAVTASGA
ncbi:hypothetical protein BH20ACT4_BH20ACT4_04070 [soil metagenome]